MACSRHFPKLEVAQTAAGLSFLLWHLMCWTTTSGRHGRGRDCGRDPWIGRDFDPWTDRGRGHDLWIGLGRGGGRFLGLGRAL